MLEMLNPSGGDVFPFAAQVYRVRKQLNAVMKVDKKRARRQSAPCFRTSRAENRDLSQRAWLSTAVFRYLRPW